MEIEAFDKLEFCNSLQLADCLLNDFDRIIHDYAFVCACVTLN